jgi:hypothetical protein
MDSLIHILYKSGIGVVFPIAPRWQEGKLTQHIAIAEPYSSVRDSLSLLSGVLDKGLSRAVRGTQHT